MADKLAALAAAFGVDVERADRAPRLVISDAERREAGASWDQVADGRGRRLLVNISAGLAFRRWPAERYVAVIRRALERDAGLRVIVIASPADATLGAQVAGDSGSPRVEFRATAGIRDAVALVATSDLVFTPDTSIAHAASAFGPLTVVMHRLSEPARWGLYPGVGEDIEHAEPTLLTLEVPPVLAAIDRVLARRG
jgi:ADP-heptose:LPS heptosyltransferase